MVRANRAGARPRPRAAAETEADAALAALRGLYGRVDALLADTTCDASTECCRFGVTGREPYVTPLELAELLRAVRAVGGLPKRRGLPLAREAAGQAWCPLLGDDGRCRVYAARPLGCRTFFCSRASRPGKAPRDEVRALLVELSALSERFDPRGGRGAPLTQAPALREVLKRAGR
ncbi:MAG: YkgJ family cysteine cluster protein [Myxococcales bacterium]|nr:YkgJ family cysteine cluster protein [Myxococcales bacterium]MBL0197869.1 YkgJ family cysteine cluster protein [Myxococcales bacterium]